MASKHLNKKESKKKNMSWLIFAILAMIGFGFYNYFVKLSSDKMNVQLATVVLYLSAMVAGLIIFLYIKFTGQTILITSEGIKFVIYAGIATAIAEVFYFLMFLQGTSLVVGLPLVVGGTILVGTLLGIAFLGETLSLIKIAGIIVTTKEKTGSYQIPL